MEQRKFEAGKTYGENKCIKVTAKTATFETVYGVERFKINREQNSACEFVNDGYTYIEA